MDKAKVNFYFDNGLEYKDVLIPECVTIGVSPKGENIIEFKMDSGFYQKDIGRFLKNENINIYTNKSNGKYSIWIDIEESYIRISDVPIEVLEGKYVNLHLLLESDKGKYIKIPLY